VRLLLIRHGYSEHARRDLIADVGGCPGLAAEGIVQARRLAARLARTGEAAGAALLTSPVPRARQTAEILGEVLAGGVTERADLRELIPGAADGMTWPGYERRYGRFDLLAEPERPFSPGGESWNGYLARVRRTMLALAGAYEGRTVAAVTHAGFVVAAMLVMFDIPRPGNQTFLDPANTGITEWEAEAAADRWRLIRYDDTAHLSALAGD
jgi:broad specificity phosphatase PhoE